MNLETIKLAVDQGLTVHWANRGYRVVKDKLGQYLVAWNLDGRASTYTGLTYLDGLLAGKEEDFYPGMDGISYIVDDALGQRDHEQDLPHDTRLVKCHVPNSPFPVWVAVFSYLPDTRLDAEEATELALDLLLELKPLTSDQVSVSLVI